MDTPMSRVAEQQRRALDFMLNARGLRHAWEEISRAPETQALARTVAALEGESDLALRATMRERERGDPDRDGHDN